MLDQESSSLAESSPKKKRGFFKTAGIGCASIAGLIIVIVIIVVMATSGGNDKSTPTAGQQVTAVAGASTNSSQASSAQATAAQAPTQAANSALAIGQTSSVGDLQLTLNSARISQGGYPAAGNEVISCDFTVMYGGTNTYDLSTLLQFDIYGSDSRKYNVTFFSDGNGTLDGTLQAGQTLSGEVAFEVPVNASPYTVRFSKFLGNSFTEWVVPQPAQ